jgi:hypothetical protein
MSAHFQGDLCIRAADISTFQKNVMVALNCGLPSNYQGGLGAAHQGMGCAVCRKPQAHRPLRRQILLKLSSVLFETSFFVAFAEHRCVPNALQ